MKRMLLCCMALVLAASARAGSPEVQTRLQYLQHCMGCHLEDGSGAPERGVPSMRGQLGLFLSVPGGREFIVQVPGVMNSGLSDADIARLMNWLLPRLSAETLPAGTAPYTEAEIARLRTTRPLDVPAARQALVDLLQTRAAAR